MAGKLKTKFLLVSLMATCLFSARLVYSDSDDSDSYASDIESPMSAVMLDLDQEDYESAIGELNALIARQGESADALNLLGYSNRKLKQYDTAYDYYTRALTIDPAHLGANEYLGELYVETDQMDKANAQLERIYKICQSDCREYVKLK